MKTEKIVEKYFKKFLDYELTINDYFYAIMRYTKSKNNYYEIGIKNIEDLIYDENGDLIDDSKEYDMLIERFIDYLQSKEELNDYFENNKYYVEEIFNNLVEKICIYCY